MLAVQEQCLPIVQQQCLLAYAVNSTTVCVQNHAFDCTLILRALPHNKTAVLKRSIAVGNSPLVRTLPALFVFCLGIVPGITGIITTRQCAVAWLSDRQTQTSDEERENEGYCSDE